MIWAALGEVLPQAVAIAISPIPIVLMIVVLVSSPSRTRGPAFLLGWIAGVFVTTVVAGIVAQGADVGRDAGAADAGSLLQAALGALFVGLAVRQWRRRPSPGTVPDEPPLLRAIGTMSGLRLVAVGAAAAAANPKKLPLTISAGVSIAQAGIEGADLTTASVVFAIVASAGIVLLVASTAVLGERVRPPLTELRSWLLANNATIVSVVFLLLGAKMLGSGLALAG